MFLYKSSEGFLCLPELSWYISAFVHTRIYEKTTILMTIVKDKYVLFYIEFRIFTLNNKVFIIFLLKLFANVREKYEY